MAVAHEKKDAETVNGLFQKIETLGKTLGPEYVALIDGVQDIAENDQLRARFLSAFGTLARLCTKNNRDCANRKCGPNVPGK
jgi:hypothetical protein